jgi:hypothetical protein
VLAGGGSVAKWKIPGVGAVEVPELSPEWRERLGRAESTLQRADQALQTLWHMRGGTPVDVALAGASLLGQALDLLSPYMAPHDVLLHSGYELVSTGVGAFLCDQVRQAPGVQAEALSQSEEGARIAFWGPAEAPRLVAGVYVGTQMDAGPYVLGGDEAALRVLVQAAAWANSNDLRMATATRSGVKSDGPRYFGRGPRNRAPVDASSGFRLLPMDPVGVYIGNPTAKWYADRLAAYQHLGHNRVVQLYGPTGVGKSTLARLLGRSMAGGAGRTLKISSAALAGLATADVVDLAHYLAPDVLLLDDLRVGHGEPDDAHLAFLEALHERVRLTVLTHMSEGDPDEDNNRFTGMRPGRIDETFVLNAPGLALRRQLLVHFWGGHEARREAGVTDKLLDDLADRTDGLTGAYIAELVQRLRAHGLEHYKGETKRMCRAVEPPRNRAQRARRRRPRRRVDKEGRPIPGALRQFELHRELTKRGKSIEGTVPQLKARLRVALEQERSEAEDARVLALAKELAVAMKNGSDDATPET